ncbi:MAG TPA: TraB/GumN family protein, partial [Cytophagaceae bacterium]|nr:TraB/GumN family protein [Cytophagaceae bacterium]
PIDGRAELEKMITLYQERKLLDLYQVIMTSEMSDSMETALLTDRNQVMADRIEKMMKEKAVFAAIGSAHLPGDKGVLKLLQERGYKVRPIGRSYR